jgi:hypothetical protein
MQPYIHNKNADIKEEQGENKKMTKKPQNSNRRLKMLKDICNSHIV